MTKQEAVDKMKQCNNADQESGHVEADEILCDLLDSLDMHEVVIEFRKLDKWYS
jgi:hypothetical protein